MKIEKDALLVERQKGATGDASVLQEFNLRRLNREMNQLCNEYDTLVTQNLSIEDKLTQLESSPPRFDYLIILLFSVQERRKELHLFRGCCKRFLNPLATRYNAFRCQMFRCPRRYDKYRRHILKALRMQKILTPKGVDGVQRVSLWAPRTYISVKFYSILSAFKVCLYVWTDVYVKFDCFLNTFKICLLYLSWY
jgi:hypothetical protein